MLRICNVKRPNPRAPNALRRNRFPAAPIFWRSRLPAQPRRGILPRPPFTPAAVQPGVNIACCVAMARRKVLLHAEFHATKHAERPLPKRTTFLRTGAWAVSVPTRVARRSDDRVAHAVHPRNGVAARSGGCCVQDSNRSHRRTVETNPLLRIHHVASRLKPSGRHPERWVISSAWTGLLRAMASILSRSEKIFLWPGRRWLVPDWDACAGRPILRMSVRPCS